MSPTGCPSCNVHVDYRYRDGTCNGNYVRELNILNLTFENCSNCNYPGFNDTQGRFKYCMSLLLKEHNWGQQNDPFWITFKNWPCMTRAIEGTNKYYTICWTNNYCCKRKYQIASLEGTKPWIILDSLILPGSDYCHGNGLECISYVPENPDYCSICVCDMNAEEQPLIINDILEKYNENHQERFHSFNSSLEIINQTTGNSFIYTYDIIGRLVYFENFEKNDIICQIYIPHSIQKGIYFYKINIHFKTYIGNFLKY